MVATVAAAFDRSFVVQQFSAQSEKVKEEKGRDKRERRGGVERGAGRDKYLGRLGVQQPSSRVM